jgi:hypothetical protein
MHSLAIYDPGVSEASFYLWRKKYAKLGLTRDPRVAAAVR